MIKNYAPQPYDGTTALPQYVTDVSTYTLIGEVPGGYKITLAELSVGSSVSAGNPLTHALPVSCETVLYALGAWMQEHNPEITSVTLVSQSCH